MVLNCVKIEPESTISYSANVLIWHLHFQQSREEIKMREYNLKVPTSFISDVAFLFNPSWVRCVQYQPNGTVEVI